MSGKIKTALRMLVYLFISIPVGPVITQTCCFKPDMSHCSLKGHLDLL